MLLAKLTFDCIATELLVVLGGTDSFFVLPAPEQVVLRAERWLRLGLCWSLAEFGSFLRTGVCCNKGLAESTVAVGGVALALPALTATALADTGVGEDERKAKFDGSTGVAGALALSAAAERLERSGVDVEVIVLRLLASRGEKVRGLLDNKRSLACRCISAIVGVA